MSKVSAELTKVFVYGTLKRGQPNHHWLTRGECGFAQFLTAGKTRVKFPLVIGTRYNIPFLLDQKGTGHYVHGEVYEVDATMLANLDVLEDYPNYYDRELQLVDAEDKELSCWLYLIRNFPEQLLKKQFLKSYSNSKEQPYCESYLDSTSNDMYEEFTAKRPVTETVTNN